MVSELFSLAVNLNRCISSKSEVGVSLICVSVIMPKETQLWLCLQTEMKFGKIKSYAVPDPGEQLPGLREQLREAALPHCTSEVGSEIIQMPAKKR